MATSSFSVWFCTPLVKMIFMPWKCFFLFYLLTLSKHVQQCPPMVTTHCTFPLLPFSQVLLPHTRSALRKKEINGLSPSLGWRGVKWRRTMGEKKEEIGGRAPFCIWTMDAINKRKRRRTHKGIVHILCKRKKKSHFSTKEKYFFFG